MINVETSTVQLTEKHDIFPAFSSPRELPNFPYVRLIGEIYYYSLQFARLVPPDILSLK